MTEDLDLAVIEIEAVQAMNTRAQSDKTYHLIVSFHSGENPTPEQLKNIEQTLCEGIGLSDHQRLSTVHTDTENLHIHIAINKIHPKTFNLIEPFYDQHKLSELCQELEIQYDLERDHTGKSQNLVSAVARDIEATTGKTSFETWCKKHVVVAIQEYLAKDGCHWDGLHTVLAEFDLQIQPNRQGTGLVI